MITKNTKEVAEKMFNDNLSLAEKITTAYMKKNIDCDYDSIYQRALIGLWNSACKFRTGLKSSFNSYARNDIIRQIQKDIKSLKYPEELISFEYMYSNDNKMLTKQTQNDILDCENVVLSDDMVNGVLNRVKRISTERNANIFISYILGSSMIEIAEKYNLTYARISQIIHRISNRLVKKGVKETYEMLLS